MASVRLRINAVDVTSSMMHPPDASWRVDRTTGPEIGIFEFELDDPNNSLTITEGEEVLFDDPDNAATIRHFGGVVTEIETFIIGIGRRYRIMCQDWIVLLDKSTFAKTYVSNTDQTIIQNIFTAGISGLTEIDVTNVQVGRTIDRLNFKGVSVRSALDIISEITGLVWYLTPFKKLFYETEGFTESNMQLSDSPDESTLISFRNPLWIRTLGQYNSVEVRGARGLSGDTQEIYAGDGTTTIFTTGAAQQANRHALQQAPSTSDRIEIERNTGTDGSPAWTVELVGLEFQDTLGVAGIDVLWNSTTRQLEFNTTPSNFTNGWRIKGRYWYNIIGIAVDENAVARQGRVYKKVLFIPEVDNEDVATDLALAFLRENGDKKRFVASFDKDGFNVGDSVLVTSTIFGLTAQLMKLERLVMTPIGGTQYTYSGTLAQHIQVA